MLYMYNLPTKCWHVERVPDDDAGFSPHHHKIYEYIEYPRISSYISYLVFSIVCNKLITTTSSLYY
jgi:hypothetical protein